MKLFRKMSIITYFFLLLENSTRNAIDLLVQTTYYDSNLKCVLFIIMMVKLTYKN